MEKILIQKQITKPINGACVCRVSTEVNERLDNLSEKTGISKQRITDYLLSKALDAVEVVECEI